MQIGDAFILGMEEYEYQAAINEKNYKLLGEYLYFVQKLSSNDYAFRRHVESKYEEKQTNKDDGRFIRIRSIDKYENYNPHKVKITLLGEIFP